MNFISWFSLSAFVTTGLLYVVLCHVFFFSMLKFPVSLEFSSTCAFPLLFLPLCRPLVSVFLSVQSLHLCFHVYLLFYFGSPLHVVLCIQLCFPSLIR